MSERGFRDKTEHFLDKLVDFYQENKKKPSSPPNPPSMPPQNTSQVNQLSAALNGLSISNPTTPAAGQAQPNFIGGFNLPGASTSTPALTSTAKPPMMPVPQMHAPGKQSLAMQMALDPSFSTSPNYSEFVDMPLPPSTPKKSSRPHSSVSSPGLGAAADLSPPVSPTRLNIPLTPSRPRRSSRSSASTSPPPTPGKNGQVQCAGITKAGKRCTRQVKVGHAINDSEDDEDNKVPRFCFQHTDEVLSPTGYYSRKTGHWVEFEDWIPGYLQKATQASLRAEMEKPKSARDVPGYIYTFEIRDPDSPKTIKLKVGRAVNLVKRIDQWGKQCGSKEQVLRGFYPGYVEEDEGSLMKGRVQAGEKAAWCHRLERLIHIELADLVSTTVYLETGWPHALDETPSTVSATPSKSRSNGNNKPCSDCGSMHKEIFEFKRWGKGQNKGEEWEKIVKPVVERWGRFVDIYVDAILITPPEVPEHPRFLRDNSTRFAMRGSIWSLVLLLQLVECSQIFNVTVGGPSGLVYDPEFIDAEPGDTIRFIFEQKNHTVTQSTFESPCEPLLGGFDTGFIPVADSQETNFPIAQLNIHDESPIWVYCRTGNHCQKGMVFAVNPGNNFAAFRAAAMRASTPSRSSRVSVVTVTATITATPAPNTVQSPAADQFSVDHQVVVGGPNGQYTFQPSSLKADVGDTVTFQFRQGNHTVTQSSFPRPCEALSKTSNSGEVGFDSGFMPVANDSASFPSYTIHINDTKAIWAYCRQAGHCNRGMVFAVNSPDEGPNTFEAFQTYAEQQGGRNDNMTEPVNNRAVRSRMVDVADFAVSLAVLLGCLL
ncbi:hypothetical protein NP233_g3053 [Leucocoprinus birnbaumii]|uniref:Cupredoxin n=1 Tax=Leucocoprinus birnbaumii TaxID=56174 RepID=A0AAD5W3N5_9AGAR|nr:hypothetical protein NP233_g3053 [Leucocoprinus birnbaumii]